MSAVIDVNNPIGTIKGIGPKKEKLLNDNNIFTIEDMLYLFPRSYQDRRTVTPIRDLKQGQDALIVGKILRKNLPPFNYKSRAPLTLFVEDDNGDGIEIVFFNARFLGKLFEMGEEYSFYGRVSANYDRYQMAHPEFSKKNSPDDIRGIIPIYPKINGISQNEIRRIQRELKPYYEQVEDFIPQDIASENRLASIPYSLENLHFPNEGRRVLEGKFRMVFSELLIMETGLHYMRKGESSVKDVVSFSCDAGDDFASNLSFPLTDDQKTVWESIKGDIQGSGRMNRLLQGDVGSGKTVIAEMAMISAAKEGYQSVIMAPTELLAKQHLETFNGDFEEYGIKPALLISSMDRHEKKAVLEGLESGDIKVLIATHAVIQENVKFSNLGLVITDEQHRFGVNQRRKLSDKGSGANVLVMTATPIPRTLAVILYGDLDVSQIRTMPAGRKPVKTTAVNSLDREEVYSFAKKEIENGRQIYVVAPLIEDSDSIDAKSAETLFEEIKNLFKNKRVALVHGNMKNDEKDSVMNAFANGDVDVLVSTVVIEVGINVPNATVIIIENYERFGLAQLHQLRGRVGRGSDESYCFLISDTESEIALKRGEIMCSTNDGFQIAEEDLILRGPGEILGTKQHGSTQPIISDLIRHIDVLEKANVVAKKIIDKDPALAEEENLLLKRKVMNMFGEEIVLQL